MKVTLIGTLRRWYTVATLGDKPLPYRERPHIHGLDLVGTAASRCNYSEGGAISSKECVASNHLTNFDLPFAGAATCTVTNVQPFVDASDCTSGSFVAGSTCTLICPQGFYWTTAASPVLSCPPTGGNVNAGGCDCDMIFQPIIG